MKIHNEMYYFATKDVRPLPSDGPCVLAWNGTAWISVHYSQLRKDENMVMDPSNYYTHWMQEPKAPSEDDTDY